VKHNTKIVLLSAAGVAVVAVATWTALAQKLMPQNIWFTMSFIFILLF